MRLYAKVRNGRLFVSVIARNGSRYVCERKLEGSNPRGSRRATGLLKSTGRTVPQSLLAA